MVNVILGRERFEGFQRCTKPLKMSAYQNVEELISVLDRLFDEIKTFEAYLSRFVFWVTNRSLRFPPRRTIPPMFQELVIKHFNVFTVKKFLTIGDKDVEKALNEFRKECMKHWRAISGEDINVVMYRLHEMKYE